MARARPLTGPARRGRPRSLVADAAILDAALALLPELGYEGLTMEAVAARAGVGKATVYRRYAGKAELVMRAAVCLTATEAPAPDTGSLRGDLTALAHNLVHLLTRTSAGRCIPELVAALPRSPGLAAEHAAFLAGRRAATQRAVKRAVARHEIPSGTDPDLVADLVAGPIFYRHLVSRARLDGAYADRIVESVLVWLAPRVAATVEG